MRRKVIAGNWKMNKDHHETAVLINDLNERLKEFPGGLDVVVCPPFTSLIVAKSLLKDSPVKLGAQNMSERDNGAFTGEISARMLKEIGCDYVILGHSERRLYFKETDGLINLKLKKALEVGLTPVVCIGETLGERESGITQLIIKSQVEGVLHELTSSEAEEIIFAYEPVWAIGTGRNATPGEANNVHQYIRKIIGQRYSWTTAEKLIIQYGGSMNPENAYMLLSQPDIDGGLIGGASLKGESFSAIVQAGIDASDLST